MANTYNLIEIDQIALDARGGCKKAVDILCKLYLPVIERLSTSIWHKISNEASFDCKCVLEIKSALKGFDPSKGHFDSLVRGRLKRTAGMFIKRGKKRRSALVSIEELHSITDESYEDTSTQTKEIISTLASGDEKKAFVLTCWSDGLYNDSEIAKLVAERFEGVNPKSYRITIQRFRESCKKLLS